MNDYDDKMAQEGGVAFGNVLIANPLLIDPNFYRSVVLIISGQGEGEHCGLVLNRPTQVRLGDLEIGGSALADAPVYLGGPCGQDRLFVLHTVPNLIQESVKVAPGLFLSNDLLRLEAVAGRVDDLAASVRFCIGYAGWEPGQLSEEICNGAWGVSEPWPAQHILDIPAAKMWQTGVRALGPDYGSWAVMPQVFDMN